MNPPDFSILTPSLNQLDYLRRCHASILDQSGVSVEHWLLDGGSTDGTAAWLRSRHDLHGLVEADRGMYDALNKGIERATGRYVAYLNCDEQYLPETLLRVKAAFENDPDVDGVHGNMMVTNPEGRLLAFRKTPPLRRLYLNVLHLYVPSCATFWRRRIFDDGHRFNPAYKAAGDHEFVLRLLNAGDCRFHHLSQYLAAFTLTGANLGHRIRRERRASLRRRAAAVPVRMLYRIEKLLRGCYRQTGPIEYAIYPPGAPTARQTFRATKASHRWPEIFPAPD